MFTRTSVVALVSVFVALTFSNTAPAAATYFIVGEFPGTESRGDSYILPLYQPDDIAHARDLILNGPQIGGPLVVAEIMAGSDGINRNWGAPGAPVWSWHVTQFIEFGDFTIEILDGSPTMVEENIEWWIGETSTGAPDVGRIGFWGYTVIGELSPEISDPAHRSPLYGVNRSTSTCENWPGGECVTGSCAHCHDTFDPEICGNDTYGLMLFAPYDNPTPTPQSDNFCFECHKGSGSVQVRDGGLKNHTYSTNFGGGAATLTTIYDAFNASGSSHNLSDVLTHAVGRGIGFTSDTNPCFVCHDHHASQQNYPVTLSGLGGVKTAIRRPLDYASTPTELWGDEDGTSGLNERMLDYTSKYQAPYYYNDPHDPNKYEPANDGTDNGSNLPQFKNFCTNNCHGLNSVSSTDHDRNLDKIDWANQHHGKTHVGGVIGATIAPYTDKDYNYVMACTDCHEPHGSPNEWLLRTCVNGIEVSIPGPGRFWYFCQACHTITQHWAPWNDELDCSQCHNHGFDIAVGGL